MTGLEVAVARTGVGCLLTTGVILYLLFRIRSKAK